ncbi:MAG: hypothetical protein ACKVT2_08670 [Saprospiraceae bacterium]
MRIRIGIFLAYLLLACILIEDALPYFAKSATMEMCEPKTESGEKDSKKEKEIEDELKEVKDKFNPSQIQNLAFLICQIRTQAASDKIPDSAHQSIFSPPPNRV